MFPDVLGVVHGYGGFREARARCSEVFQAIGRAKNRVAIEKFAEHTASGYWPGYADNEPNYLALPGYAENRDKEMYL